MEPQQQAAAHVSQRQLVSRVADMLASHDESARRQGVELCQILSPGEPIVAVEMLSAYGAIPMASLHQEHFQRAAGGVAALVAEINNASSKNYDEILMLVVKAGSLVPPGATPRHDWGVAGTVYGVSYWRTPLPWAQARPLLEQVIAENAGRLSGIDGWCRYWIAVMKGGSTRAKALRLARLLALGR
jgi:hypothetical protein